jgi:hypothetical protein
LTLSAGTIKKFENHAPVSSGIGLDKIIIANAPDLVDIDFACWTDKSTLAKTDLTITPDTENKWVILSAQDSKPIDMTAFRDIIFGNTARDINLCNPSSQYYKIKDGESLDLTGATASVGLTSLSGSAALPDLTLTLTYLKTGVVNVHYTFASQE